MIVSKKAAAIWLSWVLLLAFVVALSVFMFAWTEERSEMMAGDIREMSDTSECNSVRLRIDDICQTGTSLHMNITNAGSIAIDQFSFNIIPTYDREISNPTIYTNIRPSEVEGVRVLKQHNTAQAEIIPVLHRDDSRIFCYVSSVTERGIDRC